MSRSDDIVINDVMSFYMIRQQNRFEFLRCGVFFCREPSEISNRELLRDIIKTVILSKMTIISK